MGEMRAQVAQGSAEPDTEFPAANREQWRELVANVLRRSGASLEGVGAPERLLASTTYDGITIDPLYDAATPDPGYPGIDPFTRGATPDGAVRGGWDVRQEHADPDATNAAAAIGADLAGGVTSIWLVAGEGGVGVEGIAQALGSVDLSRFPVVLDAGRQSEAAARVLLDIHAALGVNPGQVAGNLGFDPLSAAARCGDTGSLRSDLAATARLAAGYAARFSRLRTIVVDATPYHDAGGSEAQELGAAMAAGVAYLRALTEAGLDLSAAAAQLEFRFAASADQFLTMAKLRAARAMWSRVGQVCGLRGPDRAMRQHAVTSAAMMSCRDPYVNILRTTLACFAAGAGGADSVTVRPFDAAVGLPDASARRIARNIQALLVAEAGIARVIDPAGGSGFVESVTTDLRDAGWRILQKLEGDGGMPAALESSLLADMVNETWRQRRDNLARRRDPLTGVSEFPDIAERPPKRDPRRTPAAPPTAAGALPLRRYAQDFEALRDRCDAHLAATGARPRVFLATLGPLAAHTARASLAANLLAAGGLEAVLPGPLDSPAEAAEAFAGSGTPVACLCASDTGYAEHAAAAAAALRRAGAVRILLVGAPESAGAAGEVDTYLVECDAVAVLTDLSDALGVA